MKAATFLLPLCAVPHARRPQPEEHISWPQDAPKTSNSSAGGRYHDLRPSHCAPHTRTRWGRRDMRQSAHVTHFFVHAHIPPLLQGTQYWLQILTVWVTNRPKIGPPHSRGTGVNRIGCDHCSHTSFFIPRTGLGELEHPCGRCVSLQTPAALVTG